MNNNMFLPHYIATPQEVTPHIVPLLYSNDVSNSSTSTTCIDQGNQVIEESLSFCDAIVSDSYYQPYNQLLTYQMQSPIETDQVQQTQYIDLNNYDLKPIISPQFENPEIFNAHPSPSNLSDNHLYGGRPDLKIMIPHHNAEDIKPYIIKSQSFPPSPPTSPPQHDLQKFNSNENEHVNNNNHEVKDVVTTKEDDDQQQYELPIYVNPKQYERILKRRIAREKFQKKYNISKERKPYIHQSRHNHAVRRLRGPGGRFLSASETAAALEAEQTERQRQVAEMDRRQSLNSTTSSCVSPTTPVSSTEPFFNVSMEYPYINESYQTMTSENYLIENDESWLPPLPKSINDFSNTITSNVIETSSYITNTSNMYENFSQSPLELQTQPLIYQMTSITNNENESYY